MTPDEIQNWKAQQNRRPLAVRLSDVAGHRVESQPEQAQVSATPAQAEVTWQAAQELNQKE